jgi:hypothetical protein
MNAVIKIVTTQKEFRQDQLAIIKRVLLVLAEHDMLAELVDKKQVRQLKTIKLRIVK